MSRTLMSLKPLEPNESLGHVCLEHLAQEEAQLDATLDALQGVRAAVLGCDPAALGAALAYQEKIAQLAEFLGERRSALRHYAATRLGLTPTSVTLETLSAHVPPLTASQIAAARVRLRRQAAEIDQLNRSNASLISYSLDFLQRFFDDLTGRPRDGRYGPSGALQTASSGSLINARG
jgi:hypothetical protein